MGKEQWYYTQNGQEFGPVTSGTLKQLAASGELSRDDFIWREGMAEWVAAGKTKLFIRREAPPLGPAPARPSTPNDPLPPQGAPLIAPPPLADPLAPREPGQVLEYGKPAFAQPPRLGAAPYWMVAALLLIGFFCPTYSPDSADSKWTFGNITLLSGDEPWQIKATALHPLIVGVLMCGLIFVRNVLRPLALLALLGAGVAIAAFAPWGCKIRLEPFGLQSAQGIFIMVSTLSMLVGSWVFIHRPRRPAGGAIAIYGALLFLLSIVVPWPMGEKTIVPVAEALREVQYLQHPPRALLLASFGLLLIASILSPAILATRVRAIAVVTFWVVLSSFLSDTASQFLVGLDLTEGFALEEALGQIKLDSWIVGTLLILPVAATDLLIQCIAPRKEPVY